MQLRPPGESVGHHARRKCCTNRRHDLLDGLLAAHRSSNGIADGSGWRHLHHLVQLQPSLINEFEPKRRQQKIFERWQPIDQYVAWPWPGHCHIRVIKVVYYVDARRYGSIRLLIKHKDKCTFWPEPLIHEFTESQCFGNRLIDNG